MSVFDIGEMLKETVKSTQGAYEAGYAEGYRAAMADAKRIISESFAEIREAGKP